MDAGSTFVDHPNGPLALTTTSTTTANALRGEGEPLPAPGTPWTLNAKILGLSPAAEYYHFGIALWSTTSTRALLFGFAFDGKYELALQQYADPATYDSQTNFGYQPSPNGDYFRVFSDGVNNVTYQVSRDKVVWLTFLVTNISNWVLADTIGIATAVDDSTSTTQPGRVSILEWKLTNDVPAS
jgi:hypothetical protein